MPRELWDVYSFDRRRTGRTTHRGEDLAPDEFHLVVHICVFDREGRMLIQKRNPQKRSWAGHQRICGVSARSDSRSP